MAAAVQGRRPAVPAVLEHGFRPFFLAGALCAALAVPVWLLVFAHGMALGGPLDPLRWHAHEMIFGYLAAVIAGFLLTAIPNWTGRLPVAGWPLAALVLLWLAGRVALLAVGDPGWAAALDLPFLAVLALAAGREVLAGRNLRNLPVVALAALFALGNALFHAAHWWPVLEGAGQRLALAVAALLIGLIGGRIVPSFTRNWMAKLGMDSLPVPFGPFDRLAMAATALALAVWVAQPELAASGMLLLVAAALNVARMARWHGDRTWRAPIVLVLHLGYLWLAAALALLGLAILAPAAVPATAALHALTAGAIGTMTLAVMTRASLGHTGRPIHADGWTLAIYALVTAGALLRLAAPWTGSLHLAVLAAGGILWSAAFGLFVLRYAPILLRPRRHAG